MDEEKKAVRVIDTFTGSWEKRHLPQMAQALPQRITPDHLTVLGILASLIIAAGYVLTWYSPWWLMLCNAGLFVHWYSDSLDGTLARVRHVERERYGYFVDHMSDTWTTFSICLGIGLSPLMRMDVALFLATGYLMVSSYAHIAAYVRRVFVLSYGRFGPTEVRIIIALLNTTMIFWNPVVGSYRGGIFTAVDLGGVVLGIILLLIFAGVAIRDAKELDGGGPEEPGEDNVATQGRKI